MSKINLKKLVSKQGNSVCFSPSLPTSVSQRLVLQKSAEYEIDNLPGVTLFNCQPFKENTPYCVKLLPGVYSSKSVYGWRLFSCLGGDAPLPLAQIKSQAVVARLEGSAFPTRSEALQALEIAMMLVESED